jgi:hypothetical protein
LKEGEVERLNIKNQILKLNNQSITQQSGFALGIDNGKVKNSTCPYFCVPILG